MHTLISHCNQLRPHISWTMPLPIENGITKNQEVINQNGPELVMQITQRLLKGRSKLRNLPLHGFDDYIIRLDDVIRFDPELGSIIQSYNQLPIDRKDISICKSEIHEQVQRLQNQLQVFRVNRRRLGIESPLKIKLQIHDIELQLKLLNLVLEIISNELINE